MKCNYFFILAMLATIENSWALSWYEILQVNEHASVAEILGVSDESTATEAKKNYRINAQ